MSERTRIIAWWGYVLCVVVVFEVVFQALGFAQAVGAALFAIVVLGGILKILVAQLARRAKRGPAQRGGTDAVDSRGELRP